MPDAVPPGPGLLKFNVSILEEDAYSQLIKKFWAGWRYRIPNFLSVMDWWELGKSKIKRITIVFCNELVAKRRCMRGLLSNLAQHLKSNFDNGVMSRTGPYKNTLSEIAGIDPEAVKGPKSVPEFSGLKRAKLRQLSFFGWVKSKWPIGGSLL